MRHPEYRFDPQVDQRHSQNARDNPWDDIEIIGGTDITRGLPFIMAQDQAILEIDRGNTFYVVGADSSEAEVRV